ncbi:hypothetical protein K0H61_16875 [Shewanella acanthi]|nr:hypothetical protein K0H61_16875 [Shewanella acanthi]
MVRFCDFSKTNLTLFCGLLFVLPFADLLVLVFLGGGFNIGEILTLSNGFFFEFVCASLLSLLLIDSQIIKQLWSFLDSGFKFSNSLDKSNAAQFLVPPRLKSLEHLAHGCRAPPI